MAPVSACGEGVALAGRADDAGMGEDEAGSAAPDPAATVSTTQPLPMVRQEGLAPGVVPSPLPPAPSVRAVARRVPSALPAIGRDEISDVPASARANADRRRRAREAAASTESGVEPDGEPA
jgi:hypothetical protein